MTGTPGQVSSCLDELTRFAYENPEASAVFSPGSDALTWKDLEDRVESVARDLRKLGVERGDVVAVAIPEGLDLLTILLGIIRVTAAAPLDVNFTEAEFRTRLAITSPRYLVTTADTRAAAAAHLLAMPVIEAHANLLLGPALVPEAPGTRAASELNFRRTAPDIALVLQTSATTAAPKLVPLMHRNLGAICNSMRRGLELCSTDVYLSVMPLHHILGFSCAVGQLLEGGRVVCAGGFDPLLFVPLLTKFQATWYAGGPTLHRAALQLRKEHPEQFARSSLRFIRCGSGAASPALLDELERNLKVTVVNGYGLTEVGSVTNTPPQLPRKPGSVGRTIGPEIGIMDSSGNLLPPHAEGEVVVRGDAVTPGYLEDPAANRETLYGGWFHTGDLGKMDEDGDLFITGRLKEVINRGGEMVSPLEIDHALGDHPAVAQAAAFGIQHPTLGEDVGLAVVLHPGAGATSAEIRSFLADGRLSRARIPSRIVFTDAIPVSATGKPQRKILSERFGAFHGESRPVKQQTLTPIEQGIAQIWASLLGTEMPAPVDDFFALGGDSLSASRMIAAVDEQFDLRGRLWERVEFFDSPTLRALADIVALSKAVSQSAASEAPQKDGDMSAVFLQSAGSGAQIFFFPGERMNPWYLRHLVKHLGEEWPFVVLLHELTRADQFDGFASRAVSLIQKIRSSGPLVLAGHCYGGILAYEVAQQLIAAGHAGISLVIIETPAPGYPKIRLGRYLRHAPAAMRTLFRGSAHTLVNEIASHVRFLRKRRLTPLVSSEYVAPDLPERREASDSAVSPAGVVLRTYQPKPFTGKLACLNAGDAEISERVLEDPRLGWRDLSQGPFLSRKVTGEHDSMFEADNAGELAHQFRYVLRTLS